MLDKPFDGFWMQKAYRIPDNDCACTQPGKAADKTVPINRSPCAPSSPTWPDGADVKAGRTPLRVSPSTGAPGSSRWRSRPMTARPGRRRNSGRILAPTPSGLGPSAWTCRRARTRSGTGHGQRRGEPADGAALEPGRVPCATWSKPLACARPEGVSRMTRITLALTAALALAAPAQPSPRRNPTRYRSPTATLRAPKAGTHAEGFEAAQANCLVCHSVDYIAMQPPGKGAAFWESEVTKMVKVYHRRSTRAGQGHRRLPHRHVLRRATGGAARRPPPSVT